MYTKYWSSVALAALATALDWLGIGPAGDESLGSADLAERSRACRWTS